MATVSFSDPSHRTPSLAWMLMSRHVRGGLGWAAGHLPCGAHTPSSPGLRIYRPICRRSILGDSSEGSPFRDSNGC